MNYVLELQDGSNKRWDIENYANIGSDSNCAIHVQMPGVSARHFRVEVKNNKLTIRDLLSEEGTFVNSAQIVECILADGDLISAGYADFVVHDLLKIKKQFPLASKSEYWNQQLQTLGSVAETDYPVLLLGPSGTGKDVLTKNLHQASMRRQAPFLSVNCSALTETLIESELFGHTRGSFTGAIADRKGAFEAARGGTLFLDEIGDLSYSLQAKLLRAIENAEIRPVGSDRTIKTDVRIIAATHQNLKQKIEDGLFRADLYFRLNVITIDVPSLKDRIEDFDDLLFTFSREMKVRFSYNATIRLRKHDWPGNIRELKNLVARASALYPKAYITEDHIELLLNKRDRLSSVAGPAMNSGAKYAVPQSPHGPSLSVIREIEKQMILKRLAANHGNQKLTALDLGIPKSTLHDRIKSYNIDVKVFKA
ncbi:MAG: sigma 54-interacting transcriptional regulator [Bdellovibrionota bacterium]